MLCPLPSMTRCRLRREGRDINSAKSTGVRKRRRGSDDEDTGKELLEVNKKRLLEQIDWTGVAPSRPLHLAFPSSRERNKIGRRRRVRGTHGELSRKKDRVDLATHQSTHQGYLDRDQHAGAFVRNGFRSYPQDIRIRIGTDALTNASLVEAQDPDRSHASSDSMLFDQQTFHPQRPDLREATQPSTHEGSYFPAQPCIQHGDDISRELRWNTGHTQLDPTPPLIKATISGKKGKSQSQGQKQRPHRLAERCHISEVSASGHSASETPITQFVEGIGQPFRLAFAHSDSPAGGLGGLAVDENGNGGTIHAVEAVHASETQTGFSHYLGNKREVESKSEAAGADVIVDDQPWKSFLAIPEESSSHSRAWNDSEKSTVHLHPTEHSRGAESNSWSQHATQGDQTHVSSSFISASLPSVEWGADVRARIHDRNTHARHRNKTDLKILDEDERLWQAFVFGSNKELSSDTIDEQQDGSGQRAWRDSSSYLPLSVAVSSISATPMPGRAPRTNHGVHDAAMPAPPSGSRSIMSPAATAGFVEDISDQEQDDAATAELIAFREQTVTHASLFNNASSDTRLNFPSTSGYTGPSRSSLEHGDANRDGLSEAGAGQDLGRTSDSFKSDDSEGGIDLVDVDRSS
jgi:hypothetical protein